MNKIFKVIWSKARCCYIVASELANGNSKVGTSGAVRKARRSATGLVRFANRTLEFVYRICTDE